MNKKAKTSRSAIHDSPGNVFADMGLPDAEKLLVKANLAHHICRLIQETRLTQAQAAARMGIDSPELSALMRGRLDQFSIDRLMDFLTALDRDVIITIRDPRDRKHPRLRVLAEA